MKKLIIGAFPRPSLVQAKVKGHSTPYALPREIWATFSQGETLREGEFGSICYQQEHLMIINLPFSPPHH